MSADEIITRSGMPNMLKGRKLTINAHKPPAKADDWADDEYTMFRKHPSAMDLREARAVVHALRREVQKLEDDIAGACI
jgi:polyhydroxyalkanoate synthesis regulator phasin